MNGAATDGYTVAARTHAGERRHVAVIDYHTRVDQRDALVRELLAELERMDTSLARQAAELAVLRAAVGAAPHLDPLSATCPTAP